MDITWHGETCFTLQGKNISLILNPHEGCEELKADVVLSSLGEKTAKLKSAKKIFNWPGEYEVAGIPIIAYPAWTKSRTEEGENGGGEETIMFYFEMDGIKICHLDNLGHSLSSDVLNSLGDVDILMVNGTEESNLSLKKVMEVIESIDSRSVIPMGEGSNQAFFKELGAENKEGEKKFSIKSAGEIPEEERQIIILKKV